MLAPLVVVLMVTDARKRSVPAAGLKVGVAQLDRVDPAGHRTVGHAALIGDGLQCAGRADAHRAAVHRADGLARRGAVRGVADGRAAGGGADGHRLRGGIGARRRAEGRGGALGVSDGVDAAVHDTVGQTGFIGDGLQRGIGADGHRAAVDGAVGFGGRGAVRGVADSGAAGSGRDRHRLRGAIGSQRRVGGRALV